MLPADGAYAPGSAAFLIATRFCARIPMQCQFSTGGKKSPVIWAVVYERRNAGTVRQDFRYTGRSGTSEAQLSRCLRNSTLG